MIANLDNAVLAADGGGTSCRIALDLGERRHVVTLGSANATTDLCGAGATLREGLACLAAETGVTPNAFAPLPAYFGVAGVLGQAEADGLRAALPLERVVIEDDRRAAVHGALGGGDGAVAALGTGSFFAVMRAGGTRLAGGWGSRLGDKASGFWIGREALAATLDVVDGLRLPTALSDEMLARFGGTPRGIVGFAQAATPAAIAGLAPAVIASAESGDPLGQMILSRGITHVTEVLSALGWQAGEPLCLIGGVSSAYRSRLGAVAGAGLIPPRGTALDGAVRLARQLGEKPKP